MTTLQHNQKNIVQLNEKQLRLAIFSKWMIDLFYLPLHALESWKMQRERSEQRRAVKHLSAAMRQDIGIARTDIIQSYERR